jgi:rod shape-determining protein MreC
MALSTPDSEPRLFSGPGAGLRLILLITLSVVLMVLDHRNQHLVQIRSYLAAALYPLQEAVDAPFEARRWAGENLAARSTLIRENEQFRTELLVQNGRLQRMAALEAENARMRALLESTAKVGDQVLIAEIVSVDMDRLRHRVVVNRGSRDGAFVGQALIDASGVVGQITRDRGTSAEALLITDPDHAVPVAVVRNGLRTIAVGTGDLERLSLPFMARNSDVKAGDLLVSSGLGGKFPAGYPIATVLDVRGDTGEPFLAVTAKPTAALDRVREVLLVRPQAEPVAAPEPDVVTPPAAASVTVEPGPAPASAAPPSASSEPAPEPVPAEVPPPVASPPDGTDQARTE